MRRRVRGPRARAAARERERASVTRRGEYARGEGDGQQSGQQHESQHSGTLRATSKKSDGRNSRRGVRVSGGAATATAAAAGEEHKELKRRSSRSRGRRRRGPKAPPKSRPRSAIIDPLMIAAAAPSLLLGRDGTLTNAAPWQLAFWYIYGTWSSLTPDYNAKYQDTWRNKCTAVTSTAESASARRPAMAHRHQAAHRQLAKQSK